MRTDEIVNKVFTRSFMGYDIEQVDVFLDEVIETLERYEAEKREMLSAMEYLMKKLEHGQKIPLSDMKKAIDSGRSQPKPALPGLQAVHGNAALALGENERGPWCFLASFTRHKHRRSSLLCTWRRKSGNFILTQQKPCLTAIIQ